MNNQCLERLQRYYTDSTTIPIVNNNRAKPVKNIRLTVRQGDGPSTVWFGYGIDPLLEYLEKKTIWDNSTLKHCIWTSSQR